MIKKQKTWVRAHAFAMDVGKFVQTFQSTDGRDVLPLKDSGAVKEIDQSALQLPPPDTDSTWSCRFCYYFPDEPDPALWGNVFLTQNCCFLHLVLILFFGQFQTPWHWVCACRSTGFTGKHPSKIWERNSGQKKQGLTPWYSKPKGVWHERTMEKQSPLIKRVDGTFKIEYLTAKIYCLKSELMMTTIITSPVNSNMIYQLKV